MKNIILLIVTILLTLISFIVLTILIYNRFSLINLEASSCNTNIICNSEYDLTSSGIPNMKTICKDMVSCGLINNDKNSDIDVDLDSLTNSITFPQLGCVDVDSNTKVCCRGDLFDCFGTQVLLTTLRPNYKHHVGFSFAFSSNLCKFLPSCFVENDSAPYILLPVPDFYLNKNLLDPFDFDNSGLNKVTATAFGNLGAMPITKQQGIIYVVTLPKYNSLKYFSFTPYLFQSGRYPGKFSLDLPFSSLTDSINIKDIENLSLTNTRVQDWIDDKIDELKIVLVVSHNKLITIDLVDFFSTLETSTTPYTNQLLDIPVLGLPLPANSKYGDVKDPLSRSMYKTNGTNEFIDQNTLIYDCNKDTVGIVARFAPRLDNVEVFNKWKDDVNSQSKIFVLGVENVDIGYQSFQLQDQNGSLVDGLWKGGYEINPAKYNESSWKKQNNFDGIINSQLIETTMDSITGQMKTIGYDYIRDVSMNSHPSPFPYYNKFASEYVNGFDMTWSQSGVDIMQYNVSTYGDIRDTIYPTSDTFCLGQFDVAVITANNYMNIGNVLYNNINVYDTESQTSLASIRGDEENTTQNPLTYSLIVSRMDLTCENLPAPFRFLPTGSHQNLSASPTSSFFVQVRCYIDKNTGTSTIMSPEQSKYLIRIFTPCQEKKLYPSICHDYESGLCSENTYGGKCPNDLLIYNINEGIKTDDISASVCGKFRLDKTSDKTKLTAFKWACVAIFVSSLILILIYKFVYHVSVTIFIAPILAIVVLYIIISYKYSDVDNATAYDLAQSKLQQ